MAERVGYSDRVRGKTRAGFLDPALGMVYGGIILILSTVIVKGVLATCEVCEIHTLVTIARYDWAMLSVGIALLVQFATRFYILSGATFVVVAAVTGVIAPF